MKLLITGGAGFIGSNFIRYLLKNYPDEVLINFDKLTYAGNLENLKEFEEDARYSFIKGDVCDANAFIEAAQGVDAIVHFAAESHVDRSIHSGHEFIHTNVFGAQVVIDAVKELKIPKMILVSTDEVYGDVDAPKKSKDGDPFKPSSPYSASKAAAESLAIAAIRTHEAPIMITRCTNNYGPYQFPEKLVPLFITNLIEGKKVPLYDGGTQIRDWLYVSDHCSAIDLVLRKGTLGEAYDIAAENDPEVTNREITETVLALLGKGNDMIEPVSGLRPGHDQRYAVDSSKIRSLGWEPTVTLKEGLVSTVTWYQDNEDWWKRVKSGDYQHYYQQHYQTS
ncbi:dTDP-glucose 4,6-dehydratase [bacterium CG10_46_32]|nr:MAG: dTDP-glucose 4,6-dehydratase [bacterium CG10_46_32]PIR55801.1 MAG: dTDP-glucose 4,6-dehydratase [Parcubacteria group bacterium CG10_big_fil_rev_8_21_14_0_10_46_32]